MLKITSLPQEMIVIILSYNDITLEDIINFRCVCKQFRYAAATYNKFLEQKFSQRWPIAKKRYEIFKKTKDGENINFVTKGINCAIQLRNYLSEILFYDYYYNNELNQNYFNDSIDNILDFQHVMEVDNIDEYVNNLHKNGFFKSSRDEMKYIFYYEEIKYLITQSPRFDRNSIERYCDIKMSHYEKLSSIENELDRYLEKPKREQVLEETSTFVAQHIQPRKDVCYTNVSESLDTIVQEVLNCLREKNPNHLIFSTSDETFSYWKTNNIDDNHWDETESTQIMDTLQEYIFGTLNFRPCSSSSLRVDIKCLCIDYVLERKYGQDIIIFIIYNSVARRLGLRCDMIKVAAINCIFWKPKYVRNNLENARCFYIKGENFPNCLIDRLLEYMMICTFGRRGTYPTTIRTTEMLLITMKTIIGEFLMEHEIVDLGLIYITSDDVYPYIVTVTNGQYTRHGLELMRGR